MTFPPEETCVICDWPTADHYRSMALSWHRWVLTFARHYLYALWGDCERP